MSDFLESAKNFVNTAVSRTSWEAQKQLRVRSKQSEVDKLVEQRRQLMDELGQVAMNLYQQGSLSDSQLSRLCASIFELDHDLRSRETQLQTSKDELYPADQFAPAPTMNYAPPTSSPPPAQPSQPAPPPYTPPQPYNQPAGAPPTSGYQPGPAPAQGMVPCPHCGNAVRVGSAFCRSCGGKMA